MPRPLFNKATYGVIHEMVNRKKARDQRSSSGISSMNLCLGKVVSVNYEEAKVTLRILSGADQEFQRVPVPITFPGAGDRVFLGAMPMVGDVAVLGHLTQESTGGETTPVILSWCLPGPWMGYDWLPGQPFAPDEYSMDPKDSAFTAGVFQRTRRKLRHMEPGNIVASSGQGSDLVLDEGVLLSNRRCNEIRLRDQDQALVCRTLQQFHAMAGVRVYSGMVQREATLLPTQMISDGTYWETPYQVDYTTKTPLDDEGLRKIPHPKYQVGYLSPNDVFNRIEDSGNMAGSNLSGVFFNGDIDPYVFLRRGLFITQNGFLYDGKTSSGASYGGKPGYRVSVNTDEDGVPLNSLTGGKENAESFTEYRIEVTHTSDGRLPVTEQTDNFDAERLPSAELSGTNLNGKTSPFVTLVYGSVVGNDPFTPAGREKYGIPLKPVIFTEAGDPAPDMESGIGSPVSDHAASYFGVSPVNADTPPTFWSVTKDGRVKMSVSGPKTSAFCVEANFSSGVKINTGGVFEVNAAGGFQWSISGKNEVDNRSLNLSSKGAVRIYADGDTTEGKQTKDLRSNSASTQPSLEIGGKNNVLVSSGKRVDLRSEVIEHQAQTHRLQAMSGISLNAVKNIEVNSSVYSQSVGGKADYSYFGPKDLLPTSGPHRNTVISGVGVGTVDNYLVLMGDRTENIVVGDHSTSILIGNLTYETLAGTWEARAGVNSLSVDVATGLSGSVKVGTVKMEALAGTTEISGQVSITLRSSGPATLAGLAGVNLQAPGKKGGIVSGSDLDPLTGAPLSTYGMGSPGHLLT